jgi:hypothetical protein
MKKYLKFFGLMFVLGVTLIACDDDGENIQRNGLHANAGDDRFTKVDEIITLDGSLSYDDRGESFTYEWSIKTRPAGSLVNLTSPGTASSGFSANVDGIYVVQLTIRNAQHADSDELVINVSKDEPNAPAPIVINGDINTDRNLVDIVADPTQPDYIVATDVYVRANVQVSPGVVVAFQQNTSLQVQAGFLSAKGTNEKPIVFRGLVAQPGYWKGIVIHSNNIANEFEYVTVANGGSDIVYETGVKSNVVVMGTDISAGALTVKHSSFKESGGYGLYVKGLGYLNGFSANTFTNNQINPSLYVPARIVHTLDLSGTAGLDAIETGGVMLDDMAVTWKPIQGGYYLVSSSLLVRSQLTIQTGTVLKMKSSVTIDVNGTGSLTAIGSPQAPIIFTSTAPGVNWNGLFINSGSTNNTIDHAEISRAGLDRIADAPHLANIVIGRFGSATITNTAIRFGLGYGLVAFDINNINKDVVSVNTFANLSGGYVYPEALYYPDRPELTGEWLDYWSFDKGYSIAQTYYDKQSGTWFNGAANPWLMGESNGMGIRFNENGTFTWLIAEHGPMTGCASYSAEYITGNVQHTSDLVIFTQTYWRSKFVNPCDASQNVDMEVTPQQIQLPYTIQRMYNLITGDAYWQLRFSNPDGSSFSFYRR